MFLKYFTVNVNGHEKNDWKVCKDSSKFAVNLIEQPVRISQSERSCDVAAMPAIF